MLVDSAPVWLLGEAENSERDGLAALKAVEEAAYATADHVVTVCAALSFMYSVGLRVGQEER